MVEDRLSTSESGINPAVQHPAQDMVPERLENIMARITLLDNRLSMIDAGVSQVQLKYNSC